MGILDKLRGTPLADDSDGELGRDDLVRRVVQGVLRLRRYGAAGHDTFPDGVIVRVRAAGGRVETLRAFAADPAVEREIDARLLNELAKPGELPLRRWDVSAGEGDGVEVIEDPSPVLAVLVVEGGDRDGDRYPVTPGRREWRLGRGRWHHDQRLPNDVVLTDTLSWVSRAAALLRRGSGLFELEARDQGEYLIVHPFDGTPRRPAMTASGRVAVRVGDRIELHDGKDARIVLHVRGADAP